MAITVKSLAQGRLSSTTDTNLYPSSAGTFATKQAVISAIRVVNTSDSASATLVLKLKKDSGSVIRQLTASPVTIPAKGLLVIDEAITLEGNATSGTNRHALLGATSSGGQLDYVISGVERDI